MLPEERDAPAAGDPAHSFSRLTTITYNFEGYYLSFLLVLNRHHFAASDKGETTRAMLEVALWSNLFSE